MLNPYAVTTTEGSGDRHTRSLLRGILFGILGYAAPLAILFSLCWLQYGSQVVSDNVRRLIAIHQTISIAGLAAMAPNIACMALFGLAGFRDEYFRRSGDHWFNPFLVGIATMVGYFVMLLVMSSWFPLPWTWSAERTNFVRSLFVSSFPLSLIVYQWLAARSNRR